MSDVVYEVGGYEFVLDLGSNEQAMEHTVNIYIDALNDNSSESFWERKKRAFKNNVKVGGDVDALINQEGICPLCIRAEIILSELSINELGCKVCPMRDKWVTVNGGLTNSCIDSIAWYQHGVNNPGDYLNDESMAKVALNLIDVYIKDGGKLTDKITAFTDTQV